MKFFKIALSTILVTGFMFITSHSLLAQTTLSFNPDSIFFERPSTGLIPPDAGMGISELTFGTEFYRSFLRPHELSINETFLSTSLCNLRLSPNALNFNFQKLGEFDVDWLLAKEFDPLYFAHTFAFARANGGGAFSIKPITIKVDTSVQESFVFLENRVGINVDNPKVGRITVFAQTDNYSSNIIGAIHAIKRVGVDNGAAITGTANEFGDDRPVGENFLTSTGNLAGHTLGLNAAVHGHDYTGSGVGVIGSTLGSQQVPDIWGALGFGEYAVWANGEQFSTTNTVWSTSDARFKKQIKSHSPMLQKVMQLSPKQYKYSDSKQFESLSFPSEMQHGFLAQDIEKVFPELVRDVEFRSLASASKESTFKAINYNGFFSILTAALQESHAKIVAQNIRVRTLEDERGDWESRFETMAARITKLEERVQEKDNLNQ